MFMLLHKHDKYFVASDLHKVYICRKLTIIAFFEVAKTIYTKCY